MIMTLQRNIGALFFPLIFIVIPFVSSSTPAVGIFSEPHSHHLNDTTIITTSQHYYIAASYQKWLELGGLRSIPIPYDASPALLDEIFGEINALFLPGGNSPMNDAIAYMLDKAVQSNRDDNISFPVWGTCLGFEHLVEFFGGSSVLEDGYDAENITLPLEQVDSTGASQLYKDSTVYQMVTTLPITLNNHRYGVSPAAFQANAKLSSLFTITSINKDVNGRPFVSTMEPRHPLHFPFYGVQYHPEKNLFEYGSYPKTDIAYEVIQHSYAARYVAFHLIQVWAKRVWQAWRQHNNDNKNQQRHAFTAMFPELVSYPTMAGVNFEQVYLIPSANELSRRVSYNFLAKE